MLAEAGASLVVYRDRGFTWEAAAGLVLAAYGSIMLGDTGSATAAAEEAVDLLTPLGDSWGMVHAQGMLGAHRAGRAPLRRRRHRTWPAPPRSPSGWGSSDRPRCT